MLFTVYILYSLSLKRYYVGYTSTTMVDRMSHHLSDHKGYTSRAKDWEVKYTYSLQSKGDALQLENKIKKRGAKRYLADLGQ